jgi:phosphoribosyl 1,2-cyclic phosphodiesterase
MLKVRTLASGSKGNCTYVATDTTQILIDVGLTLPQIEERIKIAEIDPNSITAILITHEHSDHICGLPRFLSKYKNCQLFLHEDAIDIVSKMLHKQRFHDLDRISGFNEPFEVGDITINFFDVPHNSEFCFGYTFENEGAKISLATDLGHIDAGIIQAMANSHIVLLESNYDINKLSASVKYHTALKRRISGSLGHLSNTAASLAVYELAKINVGQIILAHISEETNSPTLAYTFMCDFLARKGIVEGTDISIDVACQHKVGKLYTIS